MNKKIFRGTDTITLVTPATTGVSVCSIKKGPGEGTKQEEFRKKD